MRRSSLKRTALALSLLVIALLFYVVVPMHYQEIDMRRGNMGRVLEERHWQDLFGAEEFIFGWFPTMGHPASCKWRSKKYSPGVTC